MQRLRTAEGRAIAILKIIAYLAAAVGGIVLLLAAALLLALLPRCGAEVEKARDGPLSLTVRYGWIRLRLLPRKPKGEKKPQAAKPAPKKPPKKPKAKKGGFSAKGVDVGETVCLALDLLIELRNRLQIHRLRADVLLATGDAAKTGVLLGQIAAISGMVLPFLEQNFVIKDFSVQVDGDFQREKPATRAAFAVSVSLRPIHLPLILLKFRRQLLKLYRSLRADAAETGEASAASAEDIDPSTE